MCVTEDGLDSNFLDLSGNNIKLDSFTRVTNEDNGASRSDAVEDSSSSSGVSSGFKEIIATPVHGLLVDSLSEVLFLDVNRDDVSCTLLLSDGKFGSGDVSDENFTSSSSKGRHGSHTSDSSSSLDNTSGTRSDLSFGGSLHSNGNGLNHSSFVKRNILRDMETIVSGVNYTVAHNSVNGRSRPETGLALGHVRMILCKAIAQVIHAHPGGSRVGFRDTGLHANSISDLELFDFRSDFANNTSSFVS